MGVSALFFGLWNYLPAVDAAAYFNFADQKMVYGMPHFFDVTSNVFFLYVSLFGFCLFIRNYHRYDRALWESHLLVNIGVFLTCWGSSYFHLAPSAERLFWDRLPLAVVFAAITSFVFVDRVSDKFHRLFLALLSGFAIWSVWNISYGTHDLRPYLAMQGGAFLAILIILFFFRRGRVSTRSLGIALGFYAIAKLCEFYDHEIYRILPFSGHTFKHIFAAFAVFSFNMGASFAHLRMKRRDLL